MLQKKVKRSVFWIICTSVLLAASYFLTYPYIYAFQSSESIWKDLLAQTGYTICVLLALLLSLNPLCAIFPKIKFFKTINQFRRNIGVSLFVIACIHFYVAIQYIIVRLGEFDFGILLLHPQVAPGFYAFLILLALAITSNNISIRYMGFVSWKKLHKFVYLAEGLILLHLLLQGSTPALIALLGTLVIYLQRKRRRCINIL